MLYLLLILFFGALAYIGWRLVRTQNEQPSRRVIGPDDDPDFLRRLGRGDKPR